MSSDLQDGHIQYAKGSVCTVGVAEIQLCIEQAEKRIADEINRICQLANFSDLTVTIETMVLTDRQGLRWPQKPIIAKVKIQVTL